MVDELETELTITRGEVVCLQPQLAFAVGVRDRASGYGYGAGLTHLKAYLLAYPPTNLCSLKLDKLKPPATTVQFVDSLGSRSFPDAFMNLPLPSSSSKPLPAPLS